MTLEVGSRVQALYPQHDDDENGRPRTAPAGIHGQVVSVDDYPGQGLTIGIVFSNGCWVNLVGTEIDEVTAC